MKLLLKPTIVFSFLFISAVLPAQNKKDSLGLPGDNFDLYGALELFKQAKSPEDFEKAINSNDNEVNNLDLDADGKVDYVKVLDKNNGRSHLLVLQVAVSKTELQDVAVIEIEKTSDDNAHVQIVGDEDLYGKDYIIEPKNSESKTTPDNVTAKSNTVNDDVYTDPGNNSSGRSSSNNTSNNSNYNNNYVDNNPPVVINVWGWPSVQYVYGPAYVGWASPYYYGYYPGWWQPWQPIYYPVYYRRMYRYHQPYYYRTSYYRCNKAHNYYYGQRSASPTVRQRTGSGYYRDQQEVYRKNVPTGRRYNNLPANGEKQINRSQRARENNVRTAPNNPVRGTEQPKTGRSGAIKSEGNAPRKQQGAAAPRESGKVNTGNGQQRDVNTQQQPRMQKRQEQTAPRQQQPTPREQQAAPRQQQAAPQRQQGVQPTRNVGGQGASKGNVGRPR